MLVQMLSKFVIKELLLLGPVIYKLLCWCLLANRLEHKIFAYSKVKSQAILYNSTMLIQYQQPKYTKSIHNHTTPL